MLVLVLHACKHDGLVGIAESLRDHGHDHGYLRGRSVDAELFLCVGTFIYMGEQHLVGSLVQYACDAENQDGPCVAQHAAQQLAVEHVAEARELLEHAEGERGRAGQVDVEGIAHVSAVEQGKVDYVERYAHEDVQQLECGKLQCFLLLPQIGEGNAQEGVDGHGDGHHPHVVRMVGIAHEPAQRTDEQQHQRHEPSRHGAHADERGRIDAHGVFVRLVGEAEVGGLHAEGEQHHDECRVGIDVGDDTIAARSCRKRSRVERHKQVVQEAANDA